MWHEEEMNNRQETNEKGTTHLQMECSSNLLLPMPMPYQNWNGVKHNGEIMNTDRLLMIDLYIVYLYIVQIFYSYVV